MGSTGIADSGRRRLPRWVWIAAGATFAAVVATAATFGVLAWSWGESLRDEQRLLPGVVVAGIDLGEATAAAAVEQVLEVVDADLDRIVEVAYGDEVWQVTARELGAATDAQDVVAAALERTVGASFAELIRVRWLGHTADLDLDVTVHVPQDEAARFVDRVADDVDRDPLDADISWDGDAVALTAAVDGRQVDRAAAVERLRDALTGAGGTVELPVEVVVPTVTTAVAEQALPEISAAVEHQLDRVVTLTHAGRSWEVTARELGAEPDIEAVTATAITVASPVASPASTGPGGATPASDDAGNEVPLQVPDDAVTAFVDEVAAGIDVSPRNAAVGWAGRVEVTPERSGAALDRDDTIARLHDALAGATDSIQLTVVDVQPSVTAASFKQVLVVKQDERVLELHVDGTVTRTWPIAVGQGGSETPTGVFSIGAKRFEPTWYNPSPDGWGSDMPAFIGPGADNPLGLRALNWNRNGADTLIRFHGTPNEASIGEAASRGCVRMFNRDVIELFDIIPSGTAIISLRG